ncbi:MAG: hypothetical protein NVS3B12_14260 [Acidimicrobiales bacterium]
MALRDQDRPGLRLWWAAVASMCVLLVVGLRGPLSKPTVGSPVALFWVVTLGAGICWLGALWAVLTGWRDDLAEIGIVGTALAVQAQLAFVHGLTAPGVLFGPTAVVSTSVFIALPAALVVAGPILVPDSALGRSIGAAWRFWVAAWLAGASILDVAMIARPNSFPAVSLASPVAVIIGGTSLVVTLMLSRRQLRLYWLGRRPASLVASVALVALGLSGLVWIGDRPFSYGWWFAHVLDIGGVTAAAIAIGFGYRAKRTITAVLAPVTNRDPLIALDLGLSPVVHQFVAALERKDPITRDHVVRVATLAVAAGAQARLSPPRLRRLGLAALLHDIGKLHVPDAILTKPGRLTDAETATMQQHVVIGERLMCSEATLAPSAPFVRSHHERHDGGGYPDGLHAADLPLETAIISAADAYDAMANTRHYRQGMGPERAAAILAEHAGTQWSPDAVALVLTVAGTARLDGSFHAVGRPNPVMSGVCECLDALPTTARDELLALG